MGYIDKPKGNIKKINNNHIAPNQIFAENDYVSLGKREKLVEELKKNNINLFSEKYTGTKEQNYILAFALKNNKGNEKLSAWDVTETINEYGPYIKGKLKNLKGDIDHFKYNNYKKGLEVIKKLNSKFLSEIIIKGDSKEFIAKLNQVKNISDAEKIFGSMFGNQYQMIKKYLDKFKNIENIKSTENKEIIFLKKQLKNYEEIFMNFIINLKLETDGGKITKREMVGSIGKFATEVEAQLEKQIIEMSEFMKKIEKKKK